MNMRHARLISAAVGALFVAGSLAGCSSSDVKDAAKSKADSLKASAAAKAGEVASSAAAKVSSQVSGQLSGQTPEQLKQHASALLDKLSPQAKQKLQGALSAAGVETEAGAFADQPTATVAEQYLAARQAALGTGDVSALQPIATPQMVAKAQRYVKKKAAKAGKPYVIKVVGDDANGTQVCVGAHGKKAKVLQSNDQGQIAAVRNGTQAC